MPSSKSGSVYSREQARQTQLVKTGKVVGVRTVTIEGTKSPVGSAGGAIIGGIAGSSVGGGKGSAIATTIGAIAGGLAGAAVEEGVTRTEAFEITVALDDGKTISVVQSEKDVTFQVGEPKCSLDRHSSLSCFSVFIRGRDATGSGFSPTVR
jgi:outer membrane lipoprotein SlyB